MFIVYIKKELSEWSNPIIELFQIQFIKTDHNPVIDRLNITNTELIFPFEARVAKATLNSLGKDAATITTMTVFEVDYVRLEEWIDYNLKLGFSAIVLFDNSSPQLPNQYSSQSAALTLYRDKIIEKYQHRGVIVVPFPYRSIHDLGWNQIQSFTLNIGVHALRTKCKFIATIDIDEFIYLPKDPNQKISAFLASFDTHIQMSSRLITNMNSSDVLDNNVLKLAV